MENQGPFIMNNQWDSFITNDQRDSFIMKIKGSFYYENQWMFIILGLKVLLL
jgi:hypothetical protein